MLNLADKSIVENAECEWVKAENVTNIVDNKIVSKMIELCVGTNGVGLAAPQVGVMYRYFVMFNQIESKWKLYINPKYKPLGDKEQIDSTEGCLTYGKDNKYTVKRYSKILAEWKEFKGLKLTTVKARIDTFESIVFQHETDHCNGITIRMIGKKYN